MDLLVNFFLWYLTIFWWCLHFIKGRGKIFQFIWVEEHIISEDFSFLIKIQNTLPPRSPPHLFQAAKSPCHPLKGPLWLAIGYSRPHWMCLLVFSFLLENSRLAMPYNLYFWNLNTYLDSKIVVGTPWNVHTVWKEPKSVFFFSTPQYPSCCFQNEKYASSFFIKTENLTSVVKQKLIRCWDAGLVLPCSNAWL